MAIGNECAGNSAPHQFFGKFDARLRIHQAIAQLSRVLRRMYGASGKPDWVGLTQRYKGKVRRRRALLTALGIAHIADPVHDFSLLALAWQRTYSGVTPTVA